MSALRPRPSIVKLVLAQFGQALRFVFRHYPLNELHPNAESAAEAAEFAGAHDRFREMIRIVWVF